MFALQLPSLRFPAPRTRPTPAPDRTAAPTPAPSAERSAPAVVALSRTDPAGVRVVPLRPESSWPERRARDRVSNPFRLFPYRALHLARMISVLEPEG
jgi:hypothetical protein